MSELVTTRAPGALALADDELIPVLQSSLYPGAKPDSIKLVLGYCRAAGLDPMQKPVHIVPMLVSTGKKNDRGYDDKEWRDVVMPGIGLYRVQAARTGELAGIDEPEFGPAMAFHGVDAPEWCRVTVYRMIGGQRVAFTAREYWLENYATKGKDSAAPNAMWTRRPRGQIAKCAEAQALRKAFPELGSQPTADETIIEAADVVGDAPPPPPAPTVARKSAKASSAPTPAQQAAERNADRNIVDVTPKGEAPADPPAASPAPAPAPASAPATSGGEQLVGAGEVAYLKNKANAEGADLQAILADLGGLVLDRLTKDDFAKVKAKLMNRA
ncbi:MAG: phage recombination protein Bet [Steroidobacteraceae bacterium]